jgi:hypothetical protein
MLNLVSFNFVRVFLELFRIIDREVGIHVLVGVSNRRQALFSKNQVAVKDRREWERRQRTESRFFFLAL